MDIGRSYQLVRDGAYAGVAGSVAWPAAEVGYKGHSLDSFHYTLPGNPLNEMNGSVLPLATPANSQLWPTNSGQLGRVGIVKKTNLCHGLGKRHFNSGQIYPTHQPLAKVQNA